MADKHLNWYLNTETGCPEQGMLSPSDTRIGPYSSRRDALNAWKIAKKRNKEWEEEDRRWKREWDGDEDEESEDQDK